MHEKIRQIFAKFLPENIKKYIRPIYYKLLTFVKNIKSLIVRFYILYKKSLIIFKNEGFIIFCKKIINFILIHSNANIILGFYKKNKKFKKRTIRPIKRVFYISNVKSGGAKKYIDDLIENFGNCYVDFIGITNLKELKYYEKKANSEDILIFQYLFDTNFSFEDVLDFKKKSGVKMIIPIHDFYFLSDPSVFYKFDIKVHSSFIKREFFSQTIIDFLNEADYIIYPSLFVKNIFDSIFIFKNSILSNHIDYKIIDYINIPKIENEINIGIINNITLYKGLKFYPELFSINKFGNFKIKYHIFGSNNIKGKNTVFHGQYKEEEIFDLLRENKIHGLVFLNELPETYSYALTKAIISGLPILYSDIGAYKDRLINNSKFFPIKNIKNLKTALDLFLSFITNNNQKTENNFLLEKEIPNVYREIFNINYDLLLDNKFNKNKDKYEKVFRKIEPYAIYFPQFHYIKENQETFYDGYHDMINLSNAKKDNPNLETPIKNYLGYYNLKDDFSIIEKQIKIAKSYGFKGFGIYYYWFSSNTITGNKMLMKDVTDKFFSDELKDFDVFFIYANESWTKNPAFNQKNNNHIIQNEYNENSIEENFKNLILYFKNQNYKKINNKPVLFLHHPWEMTRKEIDMFYDIGNRVMIQNGFDGLELLLNDIGGAIEGYNSYSHHPNYKIDSDFNFIENGTRYIDYKKYVDNFINQNKSFDTETVFFNFNNEVRYFNHKNKDLLITKTKNNSIDYFKKFINSRIDSYFMDGKKNKIFLVNSWNEWGEQMAFEPSNESGFNLLNIFNSILLSKINKKTK